MNGGVTTLKVVKKRGPREREVAYFCPVGKALQANRQPSSAELEVCSVHVPHKHCQCGEPMGVAALECESCIEYASERDERREAKRQRVRALAAA